MAETLKKLHRRRNWLIGAGGILFSLLVVFGYHATQNRESWTDHAPLWATASVFFGWMYLAAKNLDAIEAGYLRCQHCGGYLRKIRGHFARCAECKREWEVHESIP